MSKPGQSVPPPEVAAPREVRRPDKLMDPAAVASTMTYAYSGHLATVGADGWPYVIPLLFVWDANEIHFHTGAIAGHLRANIEHDSRVCFEIDEAGEVFPYGRYECDTSIAYTSVVAFGRVRVVTDRTDKAAFFDKFMTKYEARGDDRPESFFPRLDAVTVYTIAVERMTGKQAPLPAPQDRWPAKDMTKSPGTQP